VALKLRPSAYFPLRLLLTICRSLALLTSM
jgi:hypothetical protein